LKHILYWNYHLFRKEEKPILELTIAILVHTGYNLLDR